MSSPLDRFSSNEIDAPIITDLASYFECVKEFHTRITGPGLGARQQYYYRGQTRGEADGWTIVPSLARPSQQPKLIRAYGTDKIDSIQTYLVQRLKRLSEHHASSVSLLPTPKEFLSWLTIAQHYGLPTYLTDWTLNPLVGLYFACDDAYFDGGYFTSDGHPSSGHGCDGVVYAIDLLTKAERRALDKAVLIHLDEHTGDEGKGQGGLHDDDLKYRVQEQRLVSQLEDNAGIPYPVLMVPRLLTKRIEAQAGRFIYWNGIQGLKAYTEGRAYAGWRQLKPIARIPADNKVGILEELMTYRIHPGTMMADLEGYSRYLKWGGL